MFFCCVSICAFILKTSFSTLTRVSSNFGSTRFSLLLFDCEAEVFILWIVFTDLQHRRGLV